MLRTTLLAVGVLALISLATAASPMREDVYVVKLSRPFRVGQKYHLTRTTTSEIGVARTLDGLEQPRVERHVAITLAGISEVLQVDEKGHVTGQSYTVDQLVQSQDGAERKLLKKDDVVIASVKNRETIFNLKEGALSDEARQALEDIAPLYTGQPDEDETFGSTELQKLGAHWPVNAANVARGLALDGVMVDKTDVSGEVTLAGPMTVQDIPALVFGVDLDIKKLPPPAGALPPDVTVETSSARARITVAFPQDPASTDHQPHRAEKKLVLSGKPVPGQPALRLTKDEKTTTDSTQTPIR